MLENDPLAARKVVQYLHEAHATELGLTRVLQSQIAMTPRGEYRAALERHLRETRDHAERVAGRLEQLGESAGPLQAAVGAAEAIAAQGLALAKTPFDLLRGRGGEEKILKNAKDAAATEALEIATYTALERLARAVGDERTARLAASIRADEERMLRRVLAEVPRLAARVVDAEVRDEPSYDLTATGAADAVRGAASGPPPPWRGYDRQTAAEIRRRLSRAGADRRRRVREYERAHKARAGVLEATERDPARA